jgi:penicillin amidase
VPFHEVPHVLNPKKGYLVNANKKITSDNYKYDIGVGMTGTTRADRITEMLMEQIQAGHKLT